MIVAMHPDDVEEFNSRWPGSKLDSGLYYYFEFDGTGNLVDVWCQKSSRKGARRLDASKYDGPELLALSQDAWDIASEHLKNRQALEGTKRNPTYSDYYFSDSRDRTLKLVPREDIEYWRRLQSSTRRLIPAASSEFWRLVQSGYRVMNPYIGFHKLERQLERKGAYDPKALAAWIGRRKYGKETFQAMAAAGRRNPYTDMDGMALVETGFPGTKTVWKTLSFSGYKNVSEAVSDFAMWLRSKIPLLRGYKLISKGKLILEREIPASMPVADVQDQIRHDAQVAKRRL